jgi:hypothetical protein
MRKFAEIVTDEEILQTVSAILSWSHNTHLRCYVVIELKKGKFLPEYAGKLNFYLSAVDDILRHENDNPSIGIILCKQKAKLTA